MSLVHEVISWVGHINDAAGKGSNLYDDVDVEYYLRTSPL
jgi:hypothetical protein